VKYLFKNQALKASTALHFFL